MIKLRYLILLPAAFSALPFAEAQEVRRLNRIATPKAAATAPPQASSATPTTQAQNERVKKAVEKIVAAWNTPDLAPMLADNFHDKSRLTDALNTQVPRDAKLRVLAIQGIQALGQFTKNTADGREQVFNRVSVTVRTQVEYNDPMTGFQRLDGTNEFILLITEPSL